MAKITQVVGAGGASRRGRESPRYRRRQMLRRNEIPAHLCWAPSECSPRGITRRTRPTRGRNPRQINSQHLVGPSLEADKNFSPTSVHERPNTTENRGGPETREQDDSTTCRTRRNLQNLHRRFKSGRRLPFLLNHCEGSGRPLRTKWERVVDVVVVVISLSCSNGYNCRVD